MSRESILVDEMHCAWLSLELTMLRTIVQTILSTRVLAKHTQELVDKSLPGLIV